MRIQKKFLRAARPLWIVAALCATGYAFGQAQLVSVNTYGDPFSIVNCEYVSGCVDGPGPIGLGVQGNANATQVNMVQMLIGWSINSSNACYLVYSPSANTLSLANDQGNNWTSGTPGGPGTLSNSQCSVNLSASTASFNDTEGSAQFNAMITFSPAFKGTLGVYGYASDTGGYATNFDQLLTYTAYSANASPLPSGSAAPITGPGSGMSQIVVSSNDVNRWEYIQNEAILIGADASTLANRCVVLAYTSYGGLLFLMNDTYTAWLGPITVGSPGTLGNYQCTINSGASTMSGSVNNWTLNLGVTFSPNWSANRNIYLNITDQTGADAGWVEQSTPLALYSANLPNATVNAPYSFQLTANGGFPPYTFEWNQSNPPQGLELSAQGLLSGTPKQQASYSQPNSALGISVLDSIGSYVNLGISNGFNFSIGQAPYLSGVSCSASGTPQIGSQVTFSASLSGSGYSYQWSGSASGTGQTASFTPTAGGSYYESVIVTYTSTGATGSAMCNATVTGPGGSSPPITATPSSATVGPTSTASYTIGINPIAGFSGATALSVSGLPAGATYAFNPPTINSSGTTTLTITPSATSPTGSFPIAVTASGSSRAFTANVIHVVAQPSPANLITPSPTGTVSNGNVTFTWDAGVGATQYQLTVGSQPGLNDLYNGAWTSAQSATFNLNASLPAVYVQLASNCPGGNTGRNYPIPVVPQPTTLPFFGGAPLTSYVVPNDGSSVILPFCLASSSTGGVGGSCDPNLSVYVPSLQSCNISEANGTFVTSMFASPASGGFVDGRYPSAVDITLSAPQTPPAPSGVQYYLNCLFQGEPVDWPITVQDTAPVVSAFQQYPANPDGSFYVTIWGHNFGPNPDTLQVCNQTGSGCGIMNVCLAASCGNAYYTWSDQQINALIQPDGAPNGTYDITLCSHGEGYVASCVLYVVLPFLFQAPAAGAPTAGIFYQGGGNITGTTQNVVVGQQIALQGQASFGIPMSQGWNVGVTTFVGGYKASLQQGCLVDANATDPTACVTTFTQLTSSGQNFTFYFTPPTSGNVVVTYKATRPLGAVASASTTFAVVGPALVPNRGIAVGSGPGSVSLDMNGFLKAGALPVQTLHYGTNPPNAGIYFYDDNTTVTPPPGYPNAVFEFIQVVYNAFYFATPIAGGFASPPPICAGGVDDGHAPGQNWIFSLGNTDDSPTVPQSLMTKGGPMASIGATEDFMTFLMFDPKSPGSIPVPLGVISWNWGGQASSPDGGNTFVLNPISSVAVPNGPTKGQSNVFFPTWNFPCVPLGD